MSLNKINITVAGATGYVGLDLIKILFNMFFFIYYIIKLLYL